MTGGGATADWSAPNQLNTAPTTAQLATYPFEDLAIWTESNQPSTVKGQGSNRTEGVFLTPNSSMTFSGQGTQSVPLNAQFICRTLNLSGQGTLNLKPNPADAITVPIPGNLSRSFVDAVPSVSHPRAVRVPTRQSRRRARSQS